jgi:hypothetical protein
MHLSEIFEQYQQANPAVSKEEYLSQSREIKGIDTSAHVVKGLRGQTETYIVIGNTGLYINISTLPVEARRNEILISIMLTVDMNSVFKKSTT